MTQDRYAEKIAALLRKAESTTPEEAELLIGKAQELMTKYAISQAMLEMAEGRNTDEIEQQKLTYVGILRREFGLIGWSIIQANDCKAILSRKWNPAVVINGRTYKESEVYTVTGFRSDIERVKLLDASLQIQAASALNSWWKVNGRDWMSRHEQWVEKRGFLEGFASAITQRLYQAKETAKAEAIRDEAVRTSTSEEAAGQSVELVLRSRKDQVKDWYDKKYGNNLRSVRGGTYANSSGNARSAGRSAGLTADLGSRRVGGSRREIGQ